MERIKSTIKNRGEKMMEILVFQLFMNYLYNSVLICLLLKLKTEGKK